MGFRIAVRGRPRAKGVGADDDGDSCRREVGKGCDSDDDGGSVKKVEGELRSAMMAEAGVAQDSLPMVTPWSRLV